VFDNTAHAKAYGFELEWEQQILQNLKALANVSRIQAEDSRTPQRTDKTPAAKPDWLANLSLLFRPTPRTILAARWNHVGSRNAPAPTDNAGYDLVDLTATQDDLFFKGLQLRVGVKNVGDDAPRYFQEFPSGIAELTFPGRTYFVQGAFSF
jgi:outer membrane receptor protein involved in Fe transport